MLMAMKRKPQLRRICSVCGKRKRTTNMREPYLCKDCRDEISQDITMVQNKIRGTLEKPSILERIRRALFG